MGYICNGNPKSSLVFVVDQTDCVVKILSIGRVDGDEREVTQVGSALCNLTVTVNFRKTVCVFNETGIVRVGERIDPVFASC